MRIFLSIDFSPEIIAYLVALQKQLSQDLFEGKLTNPEQLHLTLQFIGEVNEHQLQEIKNALRGITFEPFQACFDQLGVFPEKGAIHVIWVDLQSEKLHALARILHQALEKIVYLEKRSFVSHVTLARVKKVFDAQTLTKAVNSIMVESRCFVIDHFVLKQSIITTAGSVYKNLEQFNLS